MSIFNRDTSKKEIKKIMPLVDKILSYDESYSKLTDDELKHKTYEFKERLANGETLDDILPEAFATVREASWRVLEMKHYPVQLIGGIILHQGRIAEMETGSGKTLVATLPAYLNALAGNGVFVITVNDYLAKRDSIWMGKVYSFLGLTVGLVTAGTLPNKRKEAYSCDITYGTNNEFGFDYLRDNMVSSLEQRVMRGLNYALIDEVDSILIDEARTPLIISGFSDKSNDGYVKANKLVKRFKKLVIVEEKEDSDIERISKGNSNAEESEEYKDADYVVEEKKRTVALTERGIAKAEAYYHINNLADPENMEINHYLTRAMKAYGLFKRDVHYVVHNGKIIIVDESTGRLMDGRRYNDGIHQAIEAKEGVEIQKESKTLATITFQNFFRKFNKISGMTGTAKTEEEEFKNIYSLDVVEIPPNKPTQRIDKNDLVYMTRKSKIKAIIERIKECYAKGQPVLIGTVSVEKSEELSDLLKKEGIPHNILNAKYHEEEAKIIAQAGKYKAVTIATNMAGRGTDILLGGNPEYLALQELRNEGFPEELLNEATGHSNTDNVDIINIRKLFKEKENRIKNELEPEIRKVRDAGGLYIIGTERHESRRIDNQLRGRSGRQGDVGTSEFILSLEDDLFRLFGTDKIMKLISTNIDDEHPIEAKFLTKQIARSQSRIESVHFQQRKNVLEYDEVISKQRDYVYEERDKILSGDRDLKEDAIKIIKSVVEEIVDQSIYNRKAYNEVELNMLRDNFKDLKLPITIHNELDFKSMKEDCVAQAEKVFENLYTISTKERFDDYFKRMLLFCLDSNWQEHLIYLDDLKQGIGLRAYAQTKPIDAFKKESFDVFYDMMDAIKREIVSNLMSIYHGIMLDLANKMQNKRGSA